MCRTVFRRGIWHRIPPPLDVTTRPRAPIHVGHFTRALCVFHVTPRHATPRHVTSRHATSRHVTSRHVTPRRATPHHVTSRHVTSRHVTSGRRRQIRLGNRPGFVEATASLHGTRFPLIGTLPSPLRVFKAWQCQQALSHATLAISHCVCCEIRYHLPNPTAITVGYGRPGHIPLCLL